MKKQKGLLIVISGPSGAGKGTVINKLLEKDNKTRWLSVSATSRNPREGEKEGINYYYLTKEDFENKINNDYFLEYTNYAGNYYGTPKAFIKEKKSNAIFANIATDEYFNPDKKQYEIAPSDEWDFSLNSTVIAE